MSSTALSSRWWVVAAMVLAAALLPVADASAEESQEYELEEILNKARDFAPLLAEHQARRDYADAQRERADRAWWPTLETDSQLAPVPANADPTRIDRNIDEITAFNLGPYFRQTARVSMPIYTFGRISTARELAQIGVDVADLEREQAIHEHLQRTRQAYYGRQLAVAFGDLLDEGGTMVRDHLEQMEEDRAFGEADFSTSDLRRLQIFDAELDTMLLDNARLSDLTESALVYLTDMDGGSVAVPALQPEDADRSLAELEVYKDVARAHRPELRLLEHGVEASRLQEELQRREFYPNFYVGGDFQFGWSTEEPAMQRICERDEPDGPCENVDDLFTRPYSDPFDTLSFGVAVGMRWQFDFGQQRGRLRESQAQRAQIEAQQQQAIGAVMLEIEETWREAHDARKRVEIEERRYDAARRWRNQYGLQEEFAQSDEDMRDLIDPLREFYEARVGYLEAAHNYLVARAELARNIGVERLDDIEETDNGMIVVEGRPLSQD